ncbi:hypothetical protein A6M21_07100 [Desulfotomaculum copahuensis]|uniref:Glycosyltransferase 2-like domain-containing protein n=1 Tax=Desulfotomaculum copahuensis TaxID=1838280 RepID=A0A1B7LGE5_9FIRM|nr:hypothetical protein A6M21_07100 [Desulfotomaculum copahuensis]
MVPPNDPHALADAMEKLLYDNLRLEMGESAYKFMNEIFPRKNSSTILSGSHNVGISYALGKYDTAYIMILNNDIIVNPEFLAGDSQP